MNVSRPNRMALRRPSADPSVTLRSVRSRVVACGLLLAAIATLIATGGPVANAAPAAPGHSAQTATSTTASGGQISWSIAPATSTGIDTSRSIFNYANIKPGSTITDHVAILNHSPQDVAFSVYATDASGTTPANTLIFLPGTVKPRDIGAWSSFARHTARLSLIIPGGRGVVETFTLAVPRQATPGDHTGGMVAAISFTRKTNKGTLVVINQRIVVPIEMRVTGKLVAGLRVESISTGFHGSLNPFSTGWANVSYTVHNVGNVRLNGSELVTVTGPFGMSSKVHASNLPTVLPGDSVRISAQPGGLYPFGPMTAHVRVTPGVPSGAPPLAVPANFASGTASLFAVPWALIGLIILLVGATVLGLRGRGWRRRRLNAKLAAVADSVRQETERRLLGNKGTAAGPQA
jgi:hypothetical protein